VAAAPTPPSPWTPDEEPRLTTRSVLASTLLGVRPPELPTSVLVRSCGLFGISDGTARVAISRMVAAGELGPTDDGYALTGPLRDRQERQRLSRHGTTLPWTPGDPWQSAVVTAEGRSAADRAALRKAALALHLAELREGVWLRPDNLPRGELPEAEAVVASQTLALAAAPRTDEVALAARLWDLDGWSARAGRLGAAMDTSLPAFEGGDRGALRLGFVLSAAVLRHLLADPLLPAALLPHAWPGPVLRATYDRWVVAFLRVWGEWSPATEAPTPT
jgi:phenylacetic acid degradation operon negative regulatory protein